MTQVWDFLRQLAASAISIAAILALFAFLGRSVIEAKIKEYVDRATEDYRFELKAREQAAQIAEYAALAWTLKDTDSPETYRRVLQLSWQSFLWLPADVYRKLGRGLVRKDPKELVQSMVEVRKLLLKDAAGNLGVEDIIIHGQGVGKAQFDK